MSFFENVVPDIPDDEETKIIQNPWGKKIKQHDMENIEEIYDLKEKVYFAFMDVLGFKEIYEKRSLESGRNKKINDPYSEVFQYYFELINASHLNNGHCYAGQTSDSLYFYTDREDWLKDYIKIFLHFNLYAMSKDVFFRGGIAEGNLLVKHPFQFYGNSVIHSYLLESEISKNPLVTVDENTFNALQKLDKVLTDSSDSLVNTRGGRHYLNIFWPLSQEIKGVWNDEIFECRKIDEARIKNNISTNMKKYEYSDKLYAKYNFLMNEYETYKKSKIKRKLC